VVVKAILFDLDQTLTDQESAFVSAREAVAKYAASRRSLDPVRLAQSVEDIEYRICHEHPTRPLTRALRVGGRDLMWGDTTGTRPEFQPVASWVEEFRLTVWSTALAEQNAIAPDLVRDLALRFPEEMRARITAYPDALPTVRQLSAKYRLAIVTNGLPTSQRWKLSRAGLDGLFSTVVVSGDLGVAKPSARLFLTALDRLCVNPSEAVVVGDNLELDVQGAKGAGIQSVWLNRDGAKGDNQYPAPETEIRTLQELPGWLRKLE
jgi:putative hydrolase of the HAD superfamily